MAKKMPKVDWKMFWNKFNKWFDGIGEDRCTECGKLANDHPDWEEQKKRIEQMVEKYLLK